MPAQVLADLESSVGRARGAMTSATALISGIAARVKTAVDEALANGATAEELAPVTALVDGLNTDGEALAAAVVANP